MTARELSIELDERLEDSADLIGWNSKAFHRNIHSVAIRFAGQRNCAILLGEFYRAFENPARET